MDDGIFIEENGEEVIVINGFEHTRDEFDSLVELIGDPTG